MKWEGDGGNKQKEAEESSVSVRSKKQEKKLYIIKVLIQSWYNFHNN